MTRSGQRRAGLAIGAKGRYFLWLKADTVFSCLVSVNGGNYIAGLLAGNRVLATKISLISYYYLLFI